MTVPFVGNIEVWKNSPWNQDFSMTRKMADGTTTPIDLTGQVLQLQVRQYENAPGAPLIDMLSTSVAPADRIAVTNAIGGLGTFICKQSTMEALPSAPVSSALGDRTVQFTYDFMVDGEVNGHGLFIVHEGTAR